MTPEEKARLRELCEKATTGPWCKGGKKTIRTPQFGRVAVADNYCNAEHDANFIAASRTAIPALLEENDRLREALSLIHADDDGLHDTTFRAFAKAVAFSALGEAP